MASTILFGVLYSQFVHRDKEFVETFKLSIWFTTITSVIISLLGFFFADNLIDLFFKINAGPDKELFSKHGANFIRILALGNLFLSLSINMINPLTIKGKVKYGFYLSLVSLTINLSSDILFMVLI